jgi:GNAT superfamily N-acetyltransferase
MEKFVYHSSKENRISGRSGIHSLDLEIDGKIIGVAEMAYFSTPFPFYYLDELYVEYKKQGKGYGSKIMDQVENWLIEKRRAGVVTDAIDTDSPASGMYERRGWKKIPGHDHSYAFNLPKSAKIEDLVGYQLRSTEMIMRKDGKI